MFGCGCGCGQTLVAVCGCGCCQTLAAMCGCGRDCGEILKACVFVVAVLVKF